MLLDGEGQGPSPMQALLVSLAACSAMDVVSILEKKRQKVASYSVVAEGERPPAGEFPRGFTKIVMRHTLTGEDIDPLAVERAVQLSDEKYCSVAASLKAGVQISSVWEITPKRES